MKNATRLLLSLLVYAFFLTGCQEPLKGDLIIKNANVINVENGKVDPSMDILITGDRITSIQPHKSRNRYEAAQVVDGTGQFLIPGLWDMHTHTWWGYQDFFPLLIANGVTGIREMFGDMDRVKAIRQEIREGEIVGPEIISAGPIVDGKPAMWDNSDEADTPEKGRYIVRKQIDEGADFIKVYSFLDRETYLAIADECRKQGIPFCGHVPDAVTLDEAVAAGHQSAEHFLGILEYCSSRKDHFYAVMNGEIEDTTLTGANSFIKGLDFVSKYYDEKKVEHLIELLNGSNTWMSPTSTVNRAFAMMNDPAFRADERIHYMPDYAIRDWDPQGLRLSKRTQEDYDKEKAFYQLGLSIMKRMQDGGVKFLAGTDYPNPYCFVGFSLHDELGIFVEAGFTPLEALQTATLNPAIFLNKIADFGTVEIGKVANLLLLSENPLNDIENTKKINNVIVRGKSFDGQELRNGIDAIAIRNKLPKIHEEIFPTLLDNGIEAAIEQYKQLKESQPNDFNFDESQLNTLGYELLKIDRFDDAIAIFELNVEVYPDNANGYDSLGDAYAANGDNEKAITTYQIAVEKGMGDVSGKKMEELKKGN